MEYKGFEITHNGKGYQYITTSGCVDGTFSTIEYAQRKIDRIIAEKAKRLARQTKKAVSHQVRLVWCDCGHQVPASLVMSASLGTACPNCYDKMSA